MRAGLLLPLFAAGVLAQAPVLDAAFENGNLDGWSFDGTHFQVNRNNPPGAWQWLHFRVRGARGMAPRFKTNTTASDDVYRSYHRMVWRTAASEWRLMERGDKPGDGYYYFWNDTPLTEDEVYIAYWLPYTYSQLVASLAGLVQRADDTQAPASVRLEAIGASQQGRWLPYVGISDWSVPPAGKSHCVVVARQHGYESLGNHVLDGMIGFLTSPEPAAAQFRRRSIVHCYPMANPDAVVNGWTREGRARNGIAAVDFNRDWQLRSVGTGGPPSASWEIDFLREDIMRRTGGAAVLVIDLHSHAKGSTGLGWYWHHHDDAPAALALINEVWQQDRAAHAGQTVYSWPQSTAGANSTTLGAWGSGPAGGNTIATLGADSFTLEPIAAPFGAVRPVQRVRAAGAALARAMTVRY